MRSNRFLVQLGEDAGNILPWTVQALYRSYMVELPKQEFVIIEYNFIAV